jgi:hypothetical protein
MTGRRHIISVRKRITFDSTQMHNYFQSGNLRKIYPQYRKNMLYY